MYDPYFHLKINNFYFCNLLSIVKFFSIWNSSFSYSNSIKSILSFFSSDKLCFLSAMKLDTIVSITLMLNFYLFSRVFKIIFFFTCLTGLQINGYSLDFPFVMASSTPSLSVRQKTLWVSSSSSIFLKELNGGVEHFVLVFIL